jgi:hypothetical protein
MNKLTGIIALIVVGCAQAPEEAPLVQELAIIGGDECDENQCGNGNSPRFGFANVAFHELHLDPGVHPETWSGKGYMITAIRRGGWNGPNCTLNLSRAGLMATCVGSPNPISESNISVVSIFVASTTVVPQEVYELRVADNGYVRTPFWPNNNPPDSPLTRKTPMYKFIWRNFASGDWSVLCPGPYVRPSENHNLPVDWLVTFEKDRINPKTKSIDSIDSTKRWANFACGGSNPFKLHMFGLTEASADLQMLLPPNNARPTNAQKATMMKMLAGAYCGASAWTVHGHPLTYKDSLGSLTYSPAAGLDSVDARWNQYGATCLGIPRVAANATANSKPYFGQDLNTIRDAINAECMAMRRPQLPTCQGGVGPMDNQYLVSANP